MTTFQMLWDCKYCGTQKLLGVTHRHCPTCGAPQDATARYFPSDADKVRIENHVFVGVDVVCPACREANSKRNEFCFNCGSPLSEAATVLRRKQREIAEGTVAPVDSKAAALLEAQTAAAEPAARKKNRGKGAKTGHHSWDSDWRKVCWFLGGIVMLFLGVIVVNIVFAKTVQLEAVQHRWVREIEIEQFGDVREGDWCDELPAGARVVDREMKTRSTKKVADGETCSTRQTDNGDGSFSETEVCKTKYRSEPVKSLYCTYLVTKWHFERTEKAQGGTTNAAWPATRITRPGQCVGCEREGARKERYEIVLRDVQTGEEDPCELPETQWRSFEENAALTGERVPIGGLVCESLGKR